MSSPVGYYSLGQSWPRSELRESVTELYRRRRGRAAPPRFIVGNVAGATPTTTSFGDTSLGAVRNVGSQRVYTRATWAAAWTLQTYLWCDEVAWSVLPAIPTASFRWHYGSIAREAQLAFATSLKLSSVSRVFVKVEMDFEETAIGSDSFNTRTWYGILEIEQDAQDGVVLVGGVNIAVGEQRFTGYGMEKLLDDHRVNKSAILDTTVKVIGRALTFNADIRGKATGNMSAATQGGSHVFDDDAAATDWSSHRIMQYLLARNTPIDGSDAVLIPFTWSSSVLPLWDRPQLPTEGRTTLSLLSSLISPDRAMGFYFTVDETASPDEVTLNSFSFVDQPIPVTISGAAAIPANTDRVNLDFSSDVTSTATIKATTVDQFDQVVVKGARATSTFNVSWNDGSLDRGWELAQQNTYNDGGKDDAGYPAATKLKERRLWNIEARSRPDLEDVYARAIIAADWTGLVNDGEGNSIDAPAFPTSVTDATAAPGYYRDLRFHQKLVFLADIDYSTGVITTIDETATNTGEYLSAICYWQLPDTTPTRWQNIEKIGRGSRQPKKKGVKDNRKWSANLSVESDTAAFRFQVSGQPQHVVAEQEFVALSPNDKDLGDNDWRDAIFVVTADMPYYAEGIYPTTVPAGTTALTLKLDAGSAYRLDYVAPQTVVGIGVDGALLRSTAGGWLHDEQEHLRAIARMTWAWFNVERNALYFETEDLNQTAWLGSYVKSVNIGTEQYRLINSVITEIRVSSPISSSGTPEPPSMSITTNTGELDAVRIFDAGAIPITVNPVPLTISSAGVPTHMSPGMLEGKRARAEADIRGER